MQFNRRSFLCAGSASVLSAVSGCPASAQFEEISVPCVEWLAIRIVAAANRQQTVNGTGSTAQFSGADSIAFQSLPVASVASQQDTTIHVQSASGTQMRSFLIDPCSDARVLLECVDRLRIDLSSLDAVVLSEDSQRMRKALNDFLSATDGYLKKDIEVVITASGRRMKPSSFALDAGDRACVDDAGRSRMVGGQLLIVGARQNSVHSVRSENMSLIGYQSGSPRPTDPAQISANFMLLQKGLVIVTSSNEGLMDCVRAAQAASGCSDVHAIIGMNIGAEGGPERAGSILSELLELNPVHLIVAPNVADMARNIVRSARSTQIIGGSEGTRVAFR